MARKCGRPPKSTDTGDTKEKIIAATVEMIRKHGADDITVRNVCEAAEVSIGTFYHHFRNKDDLLMYFVREESFDTFALETPPERIADRIYELYMRLLERYMELGDEFLKSFYTAGNRALSAYMGEEDGKFQSGTVMARCEREIQDAVRLGVLREETDAHLVSVDICTIVKGCVFEWCLSGGRMEIETSFRRILHAYLSGFLTAASADGLTVSVPGRTMS